MKSEPEVTRLLQRAIDRVPVAEPDMERIIRQGIHRSVLRAVALSSSLLLAAGALIGTLVALSGLGSGPRPVGAHRPVERIDVGGRPIRRPVVAGGAFWSIVQLDGIGRLALVRIDARTLEARTVDVPGEPEAVEAGFGSVWVASCPAIPNDLCPNGVLVRLDATGSITGRVDVGGDLYPLAAGEGGVWVGSRSINGDATLARIDPDSLIVSRRVTFGSLEPDPCCLHDLATGEGAIWALFGDAGMLLKVDPATGSITTSGVSGHQLAVGEEAVWVNTASFGPAPILRVDPRTAQVTETIEGKGFGQPVVARGYVWLGAAALGRQGVLEILVYRIDPRTNRIDDGSVHLPLGPGQGGRLGPGGPVIDLGVGEGALWATDESAFQVVRIDLSMLSKAQPSP